MTLLVAFPETKKFVTPNVDNIHRLGCHMQAACVSNSGSGLCLDHDIANKEACGLKTMLGLEDPRALHAILSL